MRYLQQPLIPIFFPIKIKIMIKECILIILFILLHLSFAQYSPIWQKSPYIEAKDIVVVSGDQKTFGTYTITVNFQSAFSNPKIVLGIPQLRIKTDHQLQYKSYHGSQDATKFIHTLQIPNNRTAVWYMKIRYMVINTAVLTNEFTTAYDEKTTTSSSINGPAGTYRTQNFSTTLVSNLPMTGTPTCLSFLAGVKCQNAIQYQLNLTCFVISANTIRISAAVSIATLVYKFSFYAIVWDTAQLALRSFFFVDYAITSTYYNQQKSYISTPKGFFDTNYIAGLNSFSQTNNVQYNISVSNLLLINSPSTIYNDMSQFQIRVRNCSQTIAPYYNKADGLCYPVCPINTFLISTAFACDPCPNGCNVCASTTVCTICATGYSISNGICVCSNYSYSFNNICYGCHYSCETCTSGQYYSCLTCDSNMKRQAVNANTTFGVNLVQFNFICSCMTDYTDVNVTKCIQKCGDGKAISDPCDDGNTNSYDGCSSTCQIEANFTCEKNVALLSSCYYSGYMELKVVKVLKQEFQNKVSVYIQITPWIPTMALLAAPETVATNSSKGSVDCQTYLDRYIVYTFQYLQQLQLVPVNFEIRPTASGIYSRLHPANITVYLQADNTYRLLVYSNKDYQYAVNFKYVCKIIGFIILASGFLYIFGRLKWIGNLLFFTLQFQYMSMVIIPKFSPMQSSLSEIKPVMGYNEAFGAEDFDLPKYEAFWILYFNKDYFLNVNVMVTLPCFAIIMYVIYKIAYEYNKKTCIQYGGDPKKSFRSNKLYRFLQFFNWQFFMFWNFINMAVQITSMILFSQKPDMQYLPLIFFNIICIILSIFPLFFRRSDVTSYTQLLYKRNSGKQESIFSLICFIIMYIFLAFSLVVSKIIYYFIFIIPIVMILYLIKRDPFESKWIKASYIVNCCCILLTLMYNLLVIQLSQQTRYLPFGYLVIFLLDWIFNLIIWGREAYILCKYSGQKDFEQILQNNSSNPANEEQFDFFKSSIQKKNIGTPSNAKKNTKSSLLKDIIKDNNSKMGNATRRKPLNLNYDIDQSDSNSSRRRQRQQIMRIQQEKMEQQQLRRNRDKWERQMRQMKEIKQIRQRNRSQLRKTDNFSPKKSNIRQTGQKGIDRSVIQQINNKTIRYL